MSRGGSGAEDGAADERTTPADSPQLAEPAQGGSGAEDGAADERTTPADSPQLAEPAQEMMMNGFIET
ncbi:hypothetical protein FJT64_018669 [Amphibalanus amphitrite]|uniref:Uncharacterized protein n=1 Tax=Amphibalanus amphitrite TaxID=1232801 RepID=A0A6A4X2T5_AMPAM|nr:hypothetical protein FJT64_018669 [Amphibalanus amphitrite]